MDSQNNENTNANEIEQNSTEFQSEKEAKQTHYEYEEFKVNRIKTTSHVTKEKEQITILQVLAYLDTKHKKRQTMSHA